MGALCESLYGRLAGGDAAGGVHVAVSNADLAAAAGAVGLRYSAAATPTTLGWERALLGARAAAGLVCLEVGEGGRRGREGRRPPP